LVTRSCAACQRRGPLRIPKRSGCAAAALEYQLEWRHCAHCGHSILDEPAFCGDGSDTSPALKLQAQLFVIRRLPSPRWLSDAPDESLAREWPEQQHPSSGHFSPMPKINLSRVSTGIETPGSLLRNTQFAKRPTAGPPHKPAVALGPDPPNESFGEGVAGAQRRNLRLRPFLARALPPVPSPKGTGGKTRSGSGQPRAAASLGARASPKRIHGHTSPAR
jgi:hypothetical protein